jgi:hypothetical protein
MNLLAGTFVEAKLRGLCSSGNFTVKFIAASAERTPKALFGSSYVAENTPTQSAREKRPAVNRRVAETAAKPEELFPRYTPAIPFSDHYQVNTRIPGTPDP